jgi:hypothetical protein
VPDYPQRAKKEKASVLSGLLTKQVASAHVSFVNAMSHAPAQQLFLHTDISLIRVSYKQSVSLIRSRKKYSICLGASL